MKKYSLLFALLGIGTLAFAQHCVWDVSHLVVLKITTEEEQAKVPKLTINYLDKKGKVIDLFKNKSAFWPNPKVPGNPMKNSWRSDFINQKRGFWFAKDAHISILPSSAMQHISAIKIEFEDKNVAPKIIPISEKHFYLLCVGHSTWTLGEKAGKLNNFIPIEINL